LLGRHDSREVGLVLEHQFEPLAQQRCPRFGGAGAPRGKRAVGGFDGLASLGCAKRRYCADTLAGGGIGDVDMPFGVDPSTVDVALLT
jgi:hypothetical protein